MIESNGSCWDNCDYTVKAEENMEIAPLQEWGSRVYYQTSHIVFRKSAVSLQYTTKLPSNIHPVIQHLMTDYDEGDKLQNETTTMFKSGKSIPWIYNANKELFM